MKIAILVFLAMLFIASIVFLVRNIREARIAKHDFISYAKIKKDLDLLYRIGYCNKYGQIESKRNTKPICKILRESGTKENDKKYLSYANFVNSNTTKTISCFFASYFFLVTFLTIISIDLQASPCQ